MHVDSFASLHVVPLQDRFTPLSQVEPAMEDKEEMVNKTHVYYAINVGRYEIVTRARGARRSFGIRP